MKNRFNDLYIKPTATNIDCIKQSSTRVMKRAISACESRQSLQKLIHRIQKISQNKDLLEQQRNHLLKKNMQFNKKCYQRQTTSALNTLKKTNVKLQQSLQELQQQLEVITYRKEVMESMLKTRKEAIQLIRDKESCLKQINKKLNQEISQVQQRRKKFVSLQKKKINLEISQMASFKKIIEDRANFRLILQHLNNRWSKPKSRAITTKQSPVVEENKFQNQKQKLRLIGLQQQVIKKLQSLSGTSSLSWLRDLKNHKDVVIELQMKLAELQKERLCVEEDIFQLNKENFINNFDSGEQASISNLELQLEAKIIATSQKIRKVQQIQGKRAQFMNHIKLMAVRMREQLGLNEQQDLQKSLQGSLWVLRKSKANLKYMT